MRTDSSITLRPAFPEECEEITQLCLRSKAHWGYDEAFMASCREELKVSPDTLARNFTMVAACKGVIVGMVELACTGDNAYLEKLFVEPEMMGRRIGHTLLSAAIDQACGRGMAVLEIEADPGAVPFYLQAGARQIGTVASGSIAGRSLPLLHLDLN